MSLNKANSYQFSGTTSLAPPPGQPLPAEDRSEKGPRKSTKGQTIYLFGKEFSIDDLERIAIEVEGNYLNTEAYLDSDAVEMKPANPPVSRADILAALEILLPEFGLQVSQNRGKAALTIKEKGLNTKGQTNN